MATGAEATVRDLLAAALAPLDIHVVAGRELDEALDWLEKAIRKAALEEVRKETDGL